MSVRSFLVYNELNKPIPVIPSHSELQKIGAFNSSG